MTERLNTEIMQIKSKVSNISEKKPDISMVLKALNHSLRRDILLYLNEYKSATFSKLHQHVENSTKSTGQFSYHLKLLIDADIIRKMDEHYFLSQIGEKATSMIQLIDQEISTSIAQNVTRTFSQLSPREMVFIAWMFTPIISFTVTISIPIEYDNLMTLLFHIFSVVFLVSSALIAYSKLNYLPSILVLSNVVWLFFLEKDHLRIGSIYLSAGLGTGLFITGLLIENNIIQIVAGIILLSIALILSINYIRIENRILVDIRIG